MKTLSLFVLVLVGLVIWQYTKINALKQQVTKLQQQLDQPSPAPASKAARPTVRSNIQHITCPLCHGLRVLVYANGTRKDDCPLCINSVGVPLGYRDVTVPVGYQICPSCQAMGLVITNKAAHPPAVANCVQCDGRGVVPKPK